MEVRGTRKRWILDVQSENAAGCNVSPNAAVDLSPIVESVELEAAPRALLKA